MSFRELKALDGCVIFFPSRDPKGKRPQTISGPQKSARGWGEEWVQLRLDLVTLEVRLEGDTAVDLGNDLRCDVVARLLAQIDETNLPISLCKVVRSLRCSTTTNLKATLTDSFYRERLHPKFRATVEQVISQADYLKLLDSPNHRGELQTSFAEESRSFLNECGFALVSSEIRFRPLNPGMLGSEQEISEKWIEQERAQAELEAKKQAILDNMQDVKRREAAARSARVEQELKGIELQKKEAERDNAKRMHAIEIEMQSAQDEKEQTLAEARRRLDDYFRKRQEEKDAYEHSRKLEETRKRDELLALGEDSKRETERMRLEHERYLREQGLAAMQQELELANSRLAIAKVDSEKARVFGLAEAEVIEFRSKAENLLRYEEAHAAATCTERLIERLPDLVAKLSVGETGDRMMFHFGGDVTPESLGGAGGVVALSLAPVMKQLLGRLSDILGVQFHGSHGKVEAMASEKASSGLSVPDTSQTPDKGMAATGVKTESSQKNTPGEGKAPS